MSRSLFERLGGRPGIMNLIRPFYADVRQHQVIGPIFNARIANWPAHLDKICEFWARVAGGPSQYAGAMPARHMPLALEPPHFSAWLELWDFNCRRQLGPDEAREMSEIAHGIGARLAGMVLRRESFL